MKFSDSLRPEHVLLGQSETDPPEALRQLLRMLGQDGRVTHAEDFRESVLARAAEPVFDEGVGLWICHGRTNSVSSLVLGASVHAPGLEFPEWPGAVVLLVVAGIPAAFSQDYLQLIGSLVRIFRNPESRAVLLAASTAEDFLTTLDERRQEF
jgi:mannitol/fructose-specific phosphotransferase system IIA component (Ntr-type)